ncbi:ferredoxin-type protein NapF [Thalassospira sp.]|uniref:ferredoxin-type protein NapF n=1 Tax=Thalassospira sp. TaxID=1912094 RepID=UPI002735C6BB|nr:ferredoxin-type protein NapF [Thalassospira sp.]MDP2697189.1 ferredoxin-type protein NapF [Thalassospira sp.]
MSKTPVSQDRRDFLMALRGQTAPVMEPAAIRPPWAYHLFDTCTRCGDCAPACPENIIIHDPAGFPQIDFSKGECTFCGACADICRSDVFDRARDAWSNVIAVSPACFSERGIYCRSCGDGCPERAIRIMPQLGGRARVIIMEDACSGCGACVSACPADAISITPAAEAAHD